MSREFYVALAEEAAPHLRGAKQPSGFARLETEHDNLRVTMSHLLESPGTRQESLRLGVALHDSGCPALLQRRAELLEAALEMPGPNEPGAVRAAALHAAG